MRPNKRFALAALLAGLLVAPVPGRAGPPDKSNGIPLSAPQLNLLNRVTFGASPASARMLAREGTDRFLERQLHPPASDDLPPEAQAQIEALSLSHQPLEELVAELDAQQKAVNAITDPELKQAAQKIHQERLNRLGREAVTRALLRDLYAPAQLREQLVWFWFNHFNVHLYKSNIRALVGDYEEKAIRPNVLGRFRDLLRATLRHPAMLRYLDNDQNAAGRLNENYARELMELHTMGVGSGYSQSDVQELARILTGLGVVNTANPPPKIKPELQEQYVRAGLFEFNPNRHDYGDKVFLGRTIKGSGLAEVDEALDMLSRSPATARFISRKLALYFVSDNPPQRLVDAMTETFRKTDGDIAAVLKTMFQAGEFTAALGTRFKDPVHFVVSALRMAYDDKVVVNLAPVQGWIGRLAQPLYGKETPDGYPLNDGAWNGSGQMATRFEIARAIGANAAGLFKSEGPPPVEQPAFPLVANALFFASIEPTLAEPTRKALSLAGSPQEWNALFLSSPEFMRR
jgi:uncharacterized protein (DUF1800 family)